MASFLKKIFGGGARSNADDGRPMVGSFNRGYSHYGLKERFPWCLKIVIGLDEGNLYDNGLPLPDESEVANRMEDMLVEEIRSRSTAHYIGHLFNDSFLDSTFILMTPNRRINIYKI